MTTQTTLIDRLRKMSELYLRDLPECIRIPALNGSRTDEVIRPLIDATIDDLAFAIQGMEAESREIHRRLLGARELYDLARRRGAVGVTTIADAFADLNNQEVAR